LKGSVKINLCPLRFRYWWNKNWTIMENEVQLYGNPLNGDVIFRLTNMNSGSKVPRAHVLVQQPYLVYIQILNN
jgi:hypothetical protein